MVDGRNSARSGEIQAGDRVPAPSAHSCPGRAANLGKAGQHREHVQTIIIIGSPVLSCVVEQRSVEGTGDRYPVDPFREQAGEPAAVGQRFMIIYEAYRITQMLQY